MGTDEVCPLEATHPAGGGGSYALSRVYGRFRDVVHEPDDGRTLSTHEAARTPVAKTAKSQQFSLFSFG